MSDADKALDGAMKILGWGIKTWLKVMAVVLLINLVLGGLTTEYVLEFWVSRYKGQTVDIPFLPCAIGGLFVGPLSIVATVFTWILSFVL